MADNRQDFFLPDNFHGRKVCFFNCTSGTALDLSGGSNNNGTTVHGWEVHRNSNQQWKLEKVNPGSAWSPWTIRNECSGTYLELEGGNNQDGTRIVGWERGGKLNQEWFIIHRGSEPLMCWIQNAMTFTYVDLAAGDRANGTKVQGWHRECNVNTNMLWMMSMAD